MKKWAMITGATSGFGKASAYLFAKNNFNLIITGRRKDRLDELKKNLSEEFKVEIILLNYDIQSHEEAKKSFANIPNSVSQIDVLINNAGLAAGKDNFQDASFEDWNTMLRTNIDGVLYTSRLALPFLRKSDNPIIINIGSTAAKVMYGGGSVYSATKAALDALTKSMRIDLLPEKIKVSIIHPGAADTEFSMVRFKGNKEIADAVYKGYQPLLAEDIADAALYIGTRPQHVCINEMVITATSQADSLNFYKQL